MYNNKLTFNTATFSTTAPTSVASSASTLGVGISSVASSSESLITLIPALDIDTGVGLVLDLLPKDELSTLNGCLTKVLDSTLDLDTEVGLALDTLAKNELNLLDDCLIQICETAPTASTSSQPEDTDKSSKGKKRKSSQECISQVRKKIANDRDLPLIECDEFASVGIQLTAEQKKVYIEQLDSVLTSDIKENRLFRPKCAMVKGLIEGQSLDAIKMHAFYITHLSHQRKSPPCSKELVVQMFEYYHYGGLALLKGFPTSNEQRTYPARMMQEVINMYLEGESCRAIDRKLLARTQNDEFGKNEVTPAVETIRRFLERCGFTEIKE